LDAGVHGYLSKAAPGWEVLRAIREVQAGARAIPGPTACERDADAAALSLRENQILQMAAHGSTNKEVAAQLAIAADTVRMHMRSTLTKLGAKDRTHAVAIAVSLGIVRLELAFECPTYTGECQRSIASA
jgi:two-component system NarL family response regulator